MKRRHRNHGLINQMNVVPYIDVMLVLLVIFMVTAPMFVPGVINLPSVGKSSTVTQKVIQVVINKPNDYSIVQNNHSLNFANLDSVVSQVKLMGDSQTSVVISADKNIRYDDVIQAVNKLYMAGVKKVALVVKSQNG